jgi:hypothetical protein
MTYYRGIPSSSTEERDKFAAIFVSLLRRFSLLGAEKGGI